MDEFSVGDIVGVLNDAAEFVADSLLDMAEVLPIIFRSSLGSIEEGIKDTLFREDSERIEVLITLFGGEEKFIKLVCAMKLGHLLQPVIKERIIDE